jgi:hypothetical protein
MCDDESLRNPPGDELSHGARYLVCEHDDDGALLLRARLPADEGALVLAALAAGRDTLRADAACGAEQPSSVGRAASAEAAAEAATDRPAGVSVRGARLAGGPLPAQPSSTGRDDFAEAETATAAATATDRDVAADQAVATSVAVVGAQAPPSNADALVLLAETLLASGPAERNERGAGGCHDRALICI